MTLNNDRQCHAEVKMIDLNVRDCRMSHFTVTFEPISGTCNFILVKVAIFVIVVDHFIVNSVI